MSWTKEQLDAINKRDSNILVSAGAGSGKTAVLTERIVSLIKEGHSINSLLVLTFTNLAAEEMRERVRKKLNEDNDIRCKEALKYIDCANITTFDGYSLSLVKKYYYVLGISPDIKIANTYYLDIKKNKLIDDILDELYKSKDKELVLYFDLFRSKDDYSLKSAIFSSYEELTKRIDFNDYLDNYNKFYNEENINRMVNEFISSIKEDLMIFSSYIYDLYIELDDINIKLKDELLDKMNTISNLDNFNDYVNFINSFKISSRIKEKFEGYDELKKVINDEIKNLRSNICNLFTIDDIKNNILSNESLSNLFIKIIKELDKRLNEFKLNNNYYEFIDISKMAIKLVDDFKDIRDEISNNLYEILIDEYQDTSDIQEEFIKRIANNNLYMVGDVKQSIYRFRNANPYIFKEKYDNYKNNNGGIKIDLNKNFRSRDEVLSNINLIFNKAMTNELGDADFIKEHQMKFGQEEYIKFRDNIDYNMNISFYNSEDINSEDEDYNKAEIEASYISAKIRELIDSKLLIYDKDLKKNREIKYSDICIIMDRNSNFELFKQILEYNKIPTAINADSKINDSFILPIISNLINLVVSEYKRNYDEKYYHSFYSISRSYLFELSDNRIFEIVMNSKNNKVRIDNIITNKALELSYNIDSLSPKEMYLLILKEFNVESKLYKVGNINESLVVLEYIMQFIESINVLGESLIDINEYILNMFDSTTDLKYTISVKNDPGVKIMNIHKSKGLEFPICFFAGLSSKFNDADYKHKVGYFNNYGFYFEPENTKSVIKTIGLRKLTIMDISEKIRLLYVALTRTREKFYIVYPKDITKPINYKSIKRMGNILGLAIDDIIDYLSDISNLSMSKDYKLNDNKKYSNYNKEYDYILNDYLGDIISKNRISKELIEVLSDEEEANLDYGNHLHEIMEAIDFNNSDLSKLDKEDYDIISNVLKNPLFNNIKNAKTYHEHEFYYTKDNKSYHGIIDLLIIYNDHIDIIDYKLKNINHEEYDRQLNIYRDYVKTISNLNINCYLLSLLENKTREVK